MNNNCLAHLWWYNQVTTLTFSSLFLIFVFNCMKSKCSKYKYSDKTLYVLLYSYKIKKVIIIKKRCFF